jgi:hypothetical protein
MLKINVENFVHEFVSTSKKFFRLRVVGARIRLGGVPLLWGIGAKLSVRFRNRQPTNSHYRARPLFIEAILQFMK